MIKYDNKSNIDDYGMIYFGEILNLIESAKHLKMDLYNVSK